MKNKKILIIMAIVLVFALSISITIIALSGRFRDDNLETNLTDEIASTCKYCAYGDSITFGADYTRSYAQMDRPYPKLVEKDLGLLESINRGVSGATLCSNNYGRSCITSIITSDTGDYNIISVMGGVNDYATSLPLGSEGDTSITTIYGALDIIASYLTTNYSSSFIFFMTPYKAIINGKSCLTNNSSGYNLKDVADAVKYTANKYNIPVLDMFKDGSYDTVEMGKLGSDGVHPSQSFMEKYAAPQISKFIKENYPEN